MYCLVTKTVTDIHMSAFPREDYIIFSSLDQMLEYVEENPLEVSSIFITECAINSLLNTSLTKLTQVIDSPLLIFSDIKIICNTNSNLINKIEFAKKSKETLKDISIEEIDFSVSSIISLITKRQKEKQTKYNRKSIVRKSISELDNKSVISSSTLIESEEQKLLDLQDLDTDIKSNVLIEKVERKILQVTGIDTAAYSLIPYMIAHSKDNSKTLIVETDFKLLPITYVAETIQSVLKINIEEFLLKPLEVIKKINNSVHNCVVLTGSNRLLNKNISIMQIISIISASIDQDAIQNIIITSPLEKAINGVETIVIIPNNIISIIKTATVKSSRFFKSAILLGVNTSPEPIAINDIIDFSKIIKDVFKRTEGIFEILEFREDGENNAINYAISKQRTSNDIYNV